MSTKNCAACNDLREVSPEFILNGVTDALCENLANNEGLNTTDDRTDCDDLHDINDCLIGNMPDEMEAYDVCKWKDFMATYINNDYETNKAMICSMCGQWDSIDEIMAKLDDMCALISNLTDPPFTSYGMLPSHPSPSTRRIGAIPTKNGRPIMIARDNIYPAGTEQYDLFNRTQNVGIFYTSLSVTSCKTGKCEKHEWIYPSTHWYTLSKDAEIGDVLWYCTKSALQNACGFSDSLWHGYDISSWTWKETPVESGADKGKYLWLKLTVNPGGMGDNYFGIVLEGTSYPNSAPGYDAYVMNMTTAPMHYVFGC